MSHRKLLLALLVFMLASTGLFTAWACDANSPGVVIIAPLDGQTLASPVTVNAQANSVQPIVKMRVYIDGKLKYSVTPSSQPGKIDQPFNLALGPHHIVVDAFDANGARYISGVYIHVSANPPPPATLVISPSLATVNSAGTKQFSATMTNSTNTSVLWSAVGGTITSSGLFTAPAVTTNTFAQVTATSVAFPTLNSHVVVTVVPPTVGVAISPLSTAIASASTLQFSASVSNSVNTAVTWTSSFGSVSVGGLFTAPSVSQLTTGTVTATSVADISKSASALVTVNPPVVASILVNPSLISILSQGAQQFAVTTTGLLNSNVTWSAVRGTINSSGLYTAPLVSSNTSDTVTATSVPDPTKHAIALVTIIPPFESLQAVLNISPTSGAAPLNVNADSSQSADLGGTITSRSFNWGDGSSVSGQISASHVYAIPGTYTIVLTIDSSQGHISTSSRTLVVSSSPNITVAVSPKPVTLLSQQQQTFTAVVSGTGTQTVNWTAIRGTITPSGVYTAPITGTVVTDTVTATSVVSPFPSDSSTVTVIPTNVGVTISPSGTVNLRVNAQQQFTDAVTGTTNTSVNWLVDNVIGGVSATGTITTGGLYTAPPLAGNHNVTVKSVADPTKSASTAVVVTQPIAVSVSPISATVQVSKTQSFTSTVTGSSNTSVTWAVDGTAGGSSTNGTINTSGVYTAPTTSGSHVIKATSQADITANGTASALVVAPPPSSTAFVSNSINSSSTNWLGLTFQDIRLWDQGAEWIDWHIWETCKAASNSPSDPCFSWTVFDHYLAMAKNHGTNRLLYVMGHTPSWAGPLSTPTGCPVDSRIANGNMAPADLSVVGTAVSAMMQHVQNWNTTNGGRVVVNLDAWNEPNSTNFWCNLQGNSAWTTAQKNTYSVNLLMQIHQIEYNAIKAVDPSILLVSGGPQGSTSNTYISQLYGSNGSFPTGVCPFTDINGYHGYIGAGRFPEYIQTTLMPALNSALSTDCKNRHWWDTEGYGTQSTGGPLVTSDQANWLARKYLIEFSLGNVDEVLWYQYGGTSGGVLQTSGVLNAAGIAYRTVYNWIVGSIVTTKSAPVSAGSTTWSMQLANTTGSVPWNQGLAVWDTVGANTFVVPSAFACHSLVNLDGTLGQSGVAGSTVAVGQAPILLTNQGTSTASGCVAPVNHTLTVTTSGAGSGSVTSSPAGISCPGTCSASFLAGTIVSLTTAPAVGSKLSTWSGGGCSGAAGCAVTLNTDTTVDAAFSLAPVNFTLTVNLGGTGAGSVTSSPAGINCPGTCSTVYPSGTSVILTPHPASTSLFSGFGGACVGLTCTVVMGADSSVTATFSQVSVTVSPTSPSVTSGSQIQFSALVAGTANQAVTWTSSTPSAISAGGLFTAPTVTSSTSYTVTATSNDLPTAKQTVTVTVGPAPTGPVLSSHVFVITLENTSVVSTDPAALCGGGGGQPACTLDGLSTGTPIQCPTGSGNNCTSTSGANPYRRYVYGNNADMPYFQTLMSLGTRATNMYADQHGSWNMWIYLASGAQPASTNNEQCLNEANLVRSLISIYGNSPSPWRAYSEGMPFDGYQSDNTTGTTCTDATLLGNTCGYKRGHNPLINFTDTSRSATNGGLPGGSCPESGQALNSKATTNFLTDIANAGYAPRFTYITPDLGDDMHGSCPGCGFIPGQGLGHGNGGLIDADNWLQSTVPTILSRSEFQPGGDGVLIIVTDEGNTGPNGGNPYAAGCSSTTGAVYGGSCDQLASSTVSTGGGGHVAFLAIGPKIRVNSTATADYKFANVEHTLCSVLGITSCPGAGAGASDVDVFASAAVSHSLTVTRAGTGSGTVTSSPAGINCGAICTAPFLAGTSTTLTASPASGSRFTSWSGGGCSGTSTCTVVLNADTSVTATFTTNTVAVSWTASITVSPAVTYNVYRSSTSGSGYVPVATSIVGTSFTDTGLTSGHTYYYVVTAVNTNGESAFSNQATAVIP